MPKQTITVEIDLTDYFCKYGFGDGDDGAAVDLGYSLREDAIEILNDEFKKAKLPLVAEQEDVGSIHNQCYIAIRSKDEKQHWRVDWDPREQEGDSGIPEEIRKIWPELREAFSRAVERFDAMDLDSKAESDGSR